MAESQCHLKYDVADARSGLGGTVGTSTCPERFGDRHPTQKTKMRPTIKFPFLLALAPLAGCGGGGGDSTSTSPTSASVGTTTQGAKHGRQSQSEGTVNSTLAYGLKAGAADRAKAASAVKAYLKAQTAGSWGAACSYLSASLRRKLEAASRRSNSPARAGKGCGGGMAAFLGELPPAVLRRAAEIHPLSLRMKGAEALLVYRNGAGASHSLPLRREGEGWRVNFLVSSGSTP